MKKYILSLVVTLFVSAFASAQVSFFVQEPAPGAGGYEISVADGADWGSPDMTDPLNLVIGTMCLVQEDSLTCDGFAGIDNAAELSGKIAVVYRGACEFGSKSLAVQEAGAIACIIVNHSPGVIPMGGGADGPNVTIPVIMISNADGANLHDEMADCTSEAIIGNLNGYFANNLRLTNGTLLRPDTYGQVAGLNLDESEFEVETGAWVYNFGQEEETAAVLTVSVEYGGSEIWSESSDPATIAVGDSVFISMPTFSDGSYPEGDYTMSYIVEGTGEDEFSADNLEPADFVMGDTYSYARMEDGKAAPTNYTSPAEVIGERNFCIFFSDPNGSRGQVTAFDFSGTHFTETILDMDIDVVVYEWEDDFAGTATTIDNVNELDSEGYTFQEGEDDAIITLDLTNPIELEDDINYLFCLRHENEGLQLGYDNKTNYTENINLYDTPAFPQFDEGNQFTLGFGPDLVPAFSVRIATSVGLDEANEDVQITPYPNPANEYLTIPLSADLKGQALMSIFNAQGKVVSQETVNLTGSQLLVDITTLANGNYLFDLQFEDQKESTFSVVVNR